MEQVLHEEGSSIVEFFKCIGLITFFLLYLVVRFILLVNHQCSGFCCVLISLLGVSQLSLFIIIETIIIYTCA